MTDSKKHEHPDHAAEMVKLNRISGQIEGIKRMIEDDRHCPEILAQLRAVRAALRTVESNVLEKHLQLCVTEAILHGDDDEKNARITEIKELFKRYEDA